MKTPLLILSIATLLCAPVAPRALAQDPLRDLPGQLPPPDFVVKNREALGLSDGQFNTLRSLLTEGGTSHEALKKELQSAGEALHDLLAARPVDEARAQAKLQEVLAVEGRIKTLQMGVMIKALNTLTPEQMAKAHEMLRAQSTAKGGGEAELKQKFAEVRQELQKRFGSERPPEEVMDILRRVEETARAGDFAKAASMLDTLLERARKAAKAVPSPAPESNPYAAFDPGDTALESLRERFAGLEGKARDLTDESVRAELIKARGDLEKARDARDPVQVGRILSFAEKKLGITK